MTVYEHRTTLTAASGAATGSTLFIPGGIGNQLLVRANTTSTLFRVDLKDENGIIRCHYGFVRGELNDQELRLAMTGSYAIEITNADADDTFTVILSVEERR